MNEIIFEHNGYTISADINEEDVDTVLMMRKENDVFIIDDVVSGKKALLPKIIILKVIELQEQLISKDEEIKELKLRAGFWGRTASRLSTENQNLRENIRICKQVIED